jgi:hypothetical protein
LPGTLARVALRALQVDPKPEGSAKGANLGPVARAAWAAAVLGLPEAAERWASRAAMSQELGPRIWSDMVRALLTLQVRARQSADMLLPKTCSTSVVVGEPMVLVKQLALM